MNASCRPLSVTLDGDVVDRSYVEGLVVGWTGGLDESGLTQLAGRIVDGLSARGYVGVRAVVDVSGDGLRVRLHVKRLGQVLIETDLPSAESEAIRRRFRAELCGNAAQCDHRVLVAGELEAARARVAARRGLSLRVDLANNRSQPDGLDAILVAHRTRRLSAQASFDNFGMSSTGRVRGSVALSYGNVTGLGDTETLQLTYAGRHLFAASGELGIGLDDGGTRAGLEASHLTYGLGGTYAVLGYAGVADSVGSWLELPVHHRHVASADLRVEVVHKITHASIALLDAQLATRIDTLAATLSGQLIDSWGRGGTTRFSIATAAGHLKLRDAQSAALDAQTAQTAGIFGKGSFSLQHEHALDEHLSVSLWARGQLASRNLDPAEKYALTGPDAVRAFPSGLVTADEAALVSWETRLLLPLRLPGAGHVLLTGFVDEAWGRVNRHVWAGYNADPDVHLAAAGGGLSFDLLGRFTGRVVAAREIGRPYEVGQRQSQVWLQLGMHY